MLSQQMKNAGSGVSQNTRRVAKYHLAEGNAAILKPLFRDEGRFSFRNHFSYGGKVPV